MITKLYLLSYLILENYKDVRLRQKLLVRITCGNVDKWQVQSKYTRIFYKLYLKINPKTQHYQISPIIWSAPQIQWQIQILFSANVFAKCVMRNNNFLKGDWIWTSRKLVRYPNKAISSKINQKSVKQITNIHCEMQSMMPKNVENTEAFSE